MCKRKSPTEPSQNVTLKPIGGIKPTTYVGALFGLGVGLLLFFLLLFPGLFYGGAQVTISTLPSEASLTLDGKLVGASPLTLFVRAGTHTLRVQKEGFEVVTQPLQIKRRVIGSLFFPKRQEFRFSLKLLSAEDLLSKGYREFAAWTLAEPPTLIRPYPFPLKKIAQSLTRLEGKQPLSQEQWNRFFLQCLPYLTHEGFLHDYLAAYLLAQSEGKALTHRSLVESIRFFATLTQKEPNLLLFLPSLLPPAAASSLEKHPLVQRQADNVSTEIHSKSIPPTPVPWTQRRIQIGNMEFVYVPGGSFYQGWAQKPQSREPVDRFQVPTLREVSPFYLLSTEVTEEQYALFVKEMPQWAPAAREELRKKGLADERYLYSWNNSIEPPNPTYPVREVSFYAAEAYCLWLESKFPAYAFALPTEKEWEYAASLNGGEGDDRYEREIKPVHLGEKGRLGLRFMRGNVWEWTTDWYAPLLSLLPSIALKDGVEKIVKGGSSINPPDTITVSTQGSQPPHWCTPYLGFRVKANPK